MPGGIGRHRQFGPLRKGPCPGQFPPVLAVQRDGRKAAGKKGFGVALERTHRLGIAGGRVRALNLFDKKRTGGHRHCRCAALADFGLGPLHFVLQGQQQAFAQEILGMALHQEKNHEPGEDRGNQQDQPGNKNDPRVVDFLLLHFSPAAQGQEGSAGNGSVTARRIGLPVCVIH
ncbi:MAG: hypothetical protein M1449_09620 [Candidatus Thermoplasmatota archaeon]|nr:hypothetical protein [Candidatus Thermoplasmatota archaeon]